MAIAFVGAGALAAASTSPLSVALPTHSEGDFLFLLIADRTGISAFDGLSVPAGWEGPFVASQALGSAAGIRAFWKIAGASETDPISVSTTGNVSTGWGASILAWSGVHATSPLDTGHRWRQMNNAASLEATPPQSRAMTDGARAVTIAMTSDDNTLALKTGAEDGFTQRFSANGLATFCLFVADKTITSAGDTFAPTIEQTTVGPDAWYTIGSLSLRPAGATPSGPRMVHSQAGVDSNVDAPSSTTIPIHFDVLLDDLILLGISTRASSAPTITVVTSDYTEEVANTTQSPPGGFVYYKVAVGGESSIEVTNSEGNFGWIMAVQVWRGVDPTTPFDVATTVNTGTNVEEHAAPSITPVTDDTAVVSMAMIGHDPTAPLLSAAQGFQPLWLDRIWTSGTAFDESIFSADKYVPIATATTAPTFDTNDGVTTTEWVGTTMALRPLVIVEGDVVALIADTALPFS